MRRRDFIVLGGAAISWPLAAQAQQKPRVPAVGILWHAGNAAEEAIFLTQIQQGLKDLGYAEGRNITLINTFADEQYERFKSNAAELIRQKVDVIVAVTLPAALAAQRATRSIPTVFLLVPDPVAAKLVASLAHPGGNLTGLSTLNNDLQGRRVELFKEIVGASPGFALMVNPADPVAAEDCTKQVRSAADRLGMMVQLIEASQPDQIERGISSIQEGINGIMLMEDSLFFRERKRIAELATQRKLATVVFAYPMVEDGGLMAYAANPLAICRRSAVYIDKILKGAKPDELPVELPTGFDLILNLKTAKAIGLSVPPTILALADQVVE